jgi:hypothetical protein
MYQGQQQGASGYAACKDDFIKILCVIRFFITEIWLPVCAYWQAGQQKGGYDSSAKKTPAFFANTGGLKI